MPVTLLGEHHTGKLPKVAFRKKMDALLCGAYAASPEPFTGGLIVTLTEILTIIAILFAPVTALAIQRHLDRRRAKIDRRIEVFRTLMGTRAARLSPAHVHALNMIDVEFHGIKRITNAWKEYLDHLNTPAVSDEALVAWGQRGDDLFVNLLGEIAVTLRYDFDKTYLRRAFYSPQAFWQEETFQKGVRFGIAQLLAGKFALPVRLVADGDPAAPEGVPAAEPPAEDAGTA